MMQPDHSQSPKRTVIYTKQSQFKPLGDTYPVQAQVDTCKALSEGRIYADVCEGVLHTHLSAKNQKRRSGRALEIVDDVQNEQQN